MNSVFYFLLATHLFSFYTIESVETDVLQVNLYQPLGVSNLVSADIKHRFSHSQYPFINEASVTSFPGFRVGKFSIGTGHAFSNSLKVYQLLGCNVAGGHISQPLTFQTESATVICKDMAQSRLLLKADNWIGLIFPDTDLIPDARFSLLYSYMLDNDLTVGALSSFLAGYDPVLSVYATLNANSHHELSIFAGLLPFQFGIGYGLQWEAFSLRVSFQYSALFGLIPNSSFQWEY